MKWHEKFKVGQKVKVIRKIKYWNGVSWNSGQMDNTIGKVYTIVQVDEKYGYQLQTHNIYGYWYPLESLSYVKGEQLLFSFMEG